ncbi:LysR family transcriptional regulator [Paralcaligenes sp. KSB-10]|uniref:LysR family transcriptional regulator n=1 Tax=Paralcaligenes sp. KSB-10 TaxID=2901142 RepID=UPI001E2BD2C8|nr:LysR family transcriptional regulator [Paralcaligenes sp. KSB-10]UHL65440.1 LysR family transcriptional regulator [Paralcaligenes sp. KSB-10]
MEVRQLQQFVILAETLSFRATAERLHISQPPLSVSIKKLENEIGVPLFIRTTHSVQLTKAGESILELAKQTLFSIHEIPHIAKMTEKGLNGKLTLGFVGSAKYSLLQKLLTPFKKTYPQVSLHFYENNNSGIVQSLEKNEIDIGIIRVPLTLMSSIKYEIVENDRFLVAVPRQHPLAQKEEIALADLKHESFIGYTAGSVPGLHAISMLLFQGSGFLPTISQAAEQVETILFLVEIGMGIALVPSSALAKPLKNVVYKNLAKRSPQPAMGLALAYNPKYKSLTTLRFLEMASSIISQEKK